MLIELYLWLWPRMSLGHIVRRTAYLGGLALIVTGPLLYLNVNFIRQGFKPSQAGLTFQADRNPTQTQAIELQDEE